MILSQNWRQLASLQIGGAICIPMIMVGHALRHTYGAISAYVAIVIGNILLLGLALLMFRTSYPKRRTTMEQASLYFGQKGILLLTFAMVTSMLGWFGIQLHLISQSLLDILSEGLGREMFSLFWLNIGLGCLITGVALYGIQALNQLANFSLPILILTLGYALYMQESKSIEEVIPFSWKGISLVLAAAIAAVIDLPNYFRHARSSKDGQISLLLIFGLALPLIEATGVYLASQGSGDEQLLDHLKNPACPWWNGWLAFFLLLAGWTTNNTNLYSGAVSLSLLFPNLNEQKRIAWLGLVGTILSCFDLLKHFETVLNLFSLLLTGMGAVILAHALFNSQSREDQPINQQLYLQSWAVGVLIGLASLFHLLPSTATATLDTFLATFMTILIFLIGRKNYEKTNLLRS